jgi:uncharacterized protein
VKTPVKSTKNGISLNLYVQPGAAKSGWAGMFNDALKLRIAACPVEGEANRQVCAFLARYFGVPKSAVQLIQGATGRNKMVEIKGNSAELAALASLITGA